MAGATGLHKLSSRNTSAGASEGGCDHLSAAAKALRVDGSGRGGSAAWRVAVGLLLAAKRRGFAVARLHVAIFKLTAVSLAPTALVSLFSPMLDHIPLGGLLGWICSFIFYFALLGVLFDLDESDTWYCVFV